MSRRRIKPEPARCVCMPGADHHKEHGKPGKKAPLHLSSCPHSDLGPTTRPLPKKVTVKRLRLQ